MAAVNAQTWEAAASPIKPTTMRGLDESEFYEQYNVAKLFGWTPSINEMLGGVSYMDSYTPLAYAQYTAKGYKGWLQRSLDRAPTKTDLVNYLYQVADRFGIDRSIAYSQIQTESDFDPNAQSPTGPQGIAQFTRRTAAAYGLFDRFDPYASLDAWGAHMRDLLNRYNGNYELALAAYNQGEPTIDAAVQSGGGNWLRRAPAEARNYVSSILKDVQAAGGYLLDKGSLGLYESDAAKPGEDNFISRAINSPEVKDASKRVGLVILSALILALAIWRLK